MSKAQLTDPDGRPLRCGWCHELIAKCECPERTEDGYPVGLSKSVKVGNKAVNIVNGRVIADES
jgi:hypothetical protein